jgi:hypothetical protein
MSKLIIPKNYIKELDAPLIFLAGPIRNAPNWQDKAIKILFSQEPNLIIASPRRGIRNKISEYIIAGNENYFPRQRAWERHYLDLASRTGAILFWLPRRKSLFSRKVYGAMTRVELGEWMTNYKHDNSVRFCIGTDGKFPEMNTIEYDLSVNVPYKIISRSLEETCEDALRLALE